MYTGNTSTAKLTALCLVIGAATAGCNVDGVYSAWPFGRAPAAPAAKGNPSAETVDLSIVDAREVDVVEAVVANRAAYRRGLEELRAYYESHGYATKEAWAAFELEGLDRVKHFRYLMDAEIPSGALRPTDSIEEADALYNKGLDLLRRGGHGVPALYRQDLMIQAAEAFRNLIVQYPTSDKIDDAAFFCGEIHKEYLPDQAALAVKWYERAWTWNPQTPHAARFQAAVVCDYRLHDRDRALELYQNVVKHELDNNSNVRFAARRIHELTAGGRTARVNTK